jgi:DNA-binding response OmpR family regulator
MLIDNDKDILSTFKTGLQDNGFVVDDYWNPFEALSKFTSDEEGKYDLIMLDLKLDGFGTDGFKLFQDLNRTGKTVPPVCFITAYPDYYDSLRVAFPEFEQSNIKCFIQKPIQIIDLVARLTQELESS